MIQENRTKSINPLSTGAEMDIRERSDEKMETIYGASLGTLRPAELAARMILAYISYGDPKRVDWYKKAEFIDRKDGTGEFRGQLT